MDGETGGVAGIAAACGAAVTVGVDVIDAGGAAVGVDTAGIGAVVTVDVDGIAAAGVV